jgi:type 2 lantibiotic biosynthesis protein LanM
MHHFKINNIFSQSAYLKERIFSYKIEPHLRNNLTSSSTDVAKDLWMSILNSTDVSLFKKRIKWEGLKNENEVSLLETINSDIDSKELKDLLEKVIDKMRQWKYLEKFNTDKQNELPFEQYFYPVIEIAQGELLTRFCSLSFHEIFSADALNSICEVLLAELCELSQFLLFDEFNEYRPIGYRLTSAFLSDVNNKTRTPKEQYKFFIQRMHKMPEESMLYKYPVWARLLSTKILQWIDFYKSFIKNVLNDIKEIRLEFDINDNDVIDKVYSNLSDKHNGGKSVIIIEFKSKNKIVYKPKNIEIDKCFYDFLQWTKSNGFKGNFKVLKVLCKGEDYGYTEYIETHSFTSANQIKEIYENAGGLMCVLHVLKATDCHYDNLIVSRDGIVLVDCETLFQPKAKPEKSIQYKNFEPFYDSVIRTDFLPVWKFDASKKIAYDISGLGSIEPQKAKKRYWNKINTDEMHLAENEVNIFAKNIPQMNNNYADSFDYLPSILSGFKEMYLFLMNRKNLILQNNAFFNLFYGKKIRYIFRSTEVYGFALQEAFSKQYLSNGLLYNIKLDILSRAHLMSRKKNKLWKIYETEIQELLQGDIPYFFTYTNSQSLHSKEFCLNNFFSESGLSKSQNYISELSITDLKNQLYIIEGSFYSRKSNPSILPISNKIIAPNQKCNFLDESISIANLIIANAYETQGNVNWVSLTNEVNANRYIIKPLGQNLYNGKVGVAMFLSALYSVTKEDRFKIMVNNVLKDIVDDINNLDIIFVKKKYKLMGIGGMDGIGSLIYGLTKVGEYCNAKLYISAALRLSKLLTKEVIENDKKFDIISGSAGCLLSLLKLYSNCKKKHLLELAIICGNHLVESQHRNTIFPKAWSVDNEVPLTGFSHGSAGISYSLMKLYQITNDSKYKLSSLKGIEYEQELYKKNNEYPDLRENIHNKDAMYSWCHGLTGILLSRIAISKIYSNLEIEEEIARGIIVINSKYTSIIDHICCGNFGKVDTLLQYSMYHNNSTTMKMAKVMAKKLVLKSKLNNGYIINNLPQKFVSPTLFQGLSGIGYELLRVNNPENIDSVLLLE